MTNLLRFAAFLFLSISLNSFGALYDRGNGLIYDDVWDITWLQDANYAMTSGYVANGYMTWADANTWAAQLEYGGYDDWRLPSAHLMNPTNPCSSYDGSCDMSVNSTTGEMGHMFYNYLGIVGVMDTSGNLQAGYGLTDGSFIDGNSGASVSFVNLRSGYWYSEEFAPDTYRAWAFRNGYGIQGHEDKSGTFFSWAVHDGDIGLAPVPIPAAAWLFGSALIGLLAAKRKS